jgi:hypothetical protein
VKNYVPDFGYLSNRAAIALKAIALKPLLPAPSALCWPVPDSLPRRVSLPIRLPFNQLIQVIPERPVGTESLLIKQPLCAASQANLVGMSLRPHRPTQSPMPASSHYHKPYSRHAPGEHSDRPQPAGLSAFCGVLAIPYFRPLDISNRIPTTIFRRSFFCPNVVFHFQQRRAPSITSIIIFRVGGIIPHSKSEWS